MFVLFFFFKQKTAYEMRISDWSSDVCSSDLPVDHPLNVKTQAIKTWGSWGLTLVILATAIRLGIKERTPFYVLVILAAMVGAFDEPIYDAGLMLWFFAPAMWWNFYALDRNSVV